MRFDGKNNLHTLIYFFALLLFAVSLPLSKFLMSLAQWILVANFFADKDLLQKLRKLSKNKGALLIISIWILTAAGTLWSNDLDYAWKDIRVKLPILILPFIMAAEKPVTTAQLKWILTAHAWGVFAGTLVVYYGILIQHIADPRDASIFISHIRLALNTCFALFTMGWYSSQRKDNPLWQLILQLFLVLWFFGFLLALQSFTGISILLLAGLILIIVFAFRGRSRKFKLILSGSILLVLISCASWLGIYYYNNIKSDPIDPDKLELYTVNGNLYDHNVWLTQKENGHYLWLYVCYKELKPAWNKRSTIPFDSCDRKGQPLKYTLIRYMTSKGMRKDSAGVAALANSEISLVEEGTTNIKDLTTPGFIRRIESTLWEVDDYFHNNDPTNHSLIQRLALWKISCLLIREHPISGVGTGDVREAFSRKLTETQSKLAGSPMRSHNQFLAIAVALGIPALLFFLFALFYAPLRQKWFRDYLFLSFFLIAFVSMITEDTLESQPGVSFVMFFYGLLVFARQSRNIRDEQAEA
jgi:hypothetical protein